MTAGLPDNGFPDEWFAVVDIVRGGGRDDRGNPLPTTEVPDVRCLLAPRSNRDPVDRSELVDTTGVLYRFDHDVTFHETDRIRVPAGTWLKAGMWAVEGAPNVWPLGVEVPLRKE